MPHPLLRVEALDGLHQPHVAFLDQVGVRQAVAQVLARHRHHQPQVRHHQPPGGLEVVVLLQALRVVVLFLGGEQRQAVDGADVGL